MTRRIVVIAAWIVLGVPVALLLDFLGVPLPFAIAWILVFAAALLIAQQSFLDETGLWPPVAPDQIRRGSDVSRLAWALDTRTGIVGPAFRRRVSALAERRLRAQGVPPEEADAAAVDAILGPGAHAALTASELRIPELERILHALESASAPSTQERS